MPGKTAQPHNGQPGNLPPETTSFVGRGRELDMLKVVLTGGPRDTPGFGGRLVTLTGAGGVGKTRLALRAAARARTAYPDGVWLTELSPLRNADQVALTLTRTLRLITDQSARPVGETLVDWLEDKRLLLVLDSCEHLVSGCARTLLPLLAGAPGVCVLATSRQPIGIDGERRIDVDPLPVTDTEHTAAATLFAQRAGAAAPGFRLDDTNRETVLGICRRLDGVPLAIELAAAQLPELSVGSLYERLGERLPSRLDLLTTRSVRDHRDYGGDHCDHHADHGDCRLRDDRDDRDERGLPRHQALRTTIGWSHELCEPLERLLWARLSVFAGTFGVEAAERVCAGGPLPAHRVVGLLARLLDKSIVRHDQRDRGRLRMLDTVREYGTDWLRRLGDVHRMRLRHLDFYRDLARRGCAEWNTARQVMWCDRIVAEHSNLRAAVDFALAEPDTSVALDITAHAGFLWRHCGYGRDAAACLDQVLTVDAEPGPVRTLALWSRGSVAILQGDLDVAEVWADLTAQAAAEQGDARVVAAARYLAGSAPLLRGRLEEAIEAYGSCGLYGPSGLSGLSDSSGPFGSYGFFESSDWCGSAMLQARCGITLAHLLAGRFDQAGEVGEALWRDCVRIGERWVRAWTEPMLAQVALAAGDTAEAERRAREGVVGHELLHNTAGVGHALDALAEAVLARGDAARAAVLLGVSDRFWSLAGRPQLDSAEMRAARRASEDRARRAIGGEEYEKEYRAGQEMTYEDGVAYATARW
ncbi:ATP-binding protein [Streptomyces apocyni]|uniref:ATP-binding protein n=1 Tax=Streptomyces apocyni TaxID=2654677 RepID=UPI0012EA15B7|nr:NB-ARC domain-containing protein [Streptomyces apocyni]